MLDLGLPRGLSGYDVFEKIKAEPELADISVVVVTAADPSIEMPIARNKGMQGFISKPLSYANFGKTIAAVLDGQQVWGELG